MRRPPVLQTALEYGKGIAAERARQKKKMAQLKEEIPKIEAILLKLSTKNPLLFSSLESKTPFNQQALHN